MYRLLVILASLGAAAALVGLGSVAGGEEPSPGPSPAPAAGRSEPPAVERPALLDEQEYASWTSNREKPEHAPPSESKIGKTGEGPEDSPEVGFTRSSEGGSVFVPSGDVFEVGKEVTVRRPVVEIPAQAGEDYSGNGTVARDSEPIRAAFYYPWFPQAWTQDGVYPFTRFKPELGYYSSADRDVIRRHIGAMQYGRIDAGISSWWGEGDHTDRNFQTILRESGKTGFRWAVYYEAEGTGNPSASRIRADLYYLYSRYALDPSYLKIDGRFAVFVFGSGDDACEMAERWREGTIPTAYIVLKAFPDYEDCESQPDGWHVYNPFVPASSLGADSYSISPGFAKIGDSSALERDLERWRDNVRAMATSGARLQLIVSFNEWGEGSSVESADEWASPSGYGQYLDVLHELQ